MPEASMHPYGLTVLPLCVGVLACAQTQTHTSSLEHRERTWQVNSSTAQSIEKKRCTFTSAA